MSQIDELVAGYCKRAGAELPAAGDDGTYKLRFDGRYDISLASAGRDRVLLRADLPQLRRDGNREDGLRRLMRINLLLAGRKHSTMTIDMETDTPFLYDVLNLGDAMEPSNFRSITMFVNEVAAFSKALDRIH